MKEKAKVKKMERGRRPANKTTEPVRLLDDLMPHQIVAISAGAFEKYDKALSKPFVDRLRTYPEEREQVSRDLVDTLLGIEGDSNHLAQISSDDHLAQELSAQTREIITVRDRLNELTVLIRRYPFSRTRITRVGWLHLCVLMYLQELYALSERVDKHLVMVNRIWRPTVLRNAVQSTTRTLRNFSQQTFEPLKDIRGRHVHSETFMDQAMQRARAWEVMSKLQPAPFKSKANYFYKLSKGEWNHKMEDSNTTLGKFLDLTGHMLHSLLFDKLGRLLHNSLPHAPKREPR